MARKNTFLYFLQFVLCLSVAVSAAAQEQYTQKILAVVNGEAITQTDVDEILAPIYLQYKNTYSGDALNEKISTAKADILSQLIEDKLILEQAKKKEVTVEDKEVNAMIDKLKSNFKSVEEFEAVLKNQNVSLIELKKRYREQLLIKKTVSMEVLNKIVVSPAEILDYYQSHTNDFIVPVQFRLRNIFLAFENSNELEVEKKANDIYDQLQKGTEFIELVEKYSEAPNVIDSGDMGYAKQPSLRKEINDAVSPLSVGQFTKPIKTSSGFYLFKVEDKKEAAVAPLEDVKEIINKNIYETKAKSKLDEWIKKLKESAYIEVKKDEKEKS